MRSSLLCDDFSSRVRLFLIPASLLFRQVQAGKIQKGNGQRRTRARTLPALHMALDDFATVLTFSVYSLLSLSALFARPLPLPLGTGLGLNISKSIVELHGGQIGYTSVPGST